MGVRSQTFSVKFSRSWWKCQSKSFSLAYPILLDWEVGPVRAVLWYLLGKTGYMGWFLQPSSVYLLMRHLSVNSDISCKDFGHRIGRRMNLKVQTSIMRGLPSRNATFFHSHFSPIHWMLLYARYKGKIWIACPGYFFPLSPHIFSGSLNKPGSRRKTLRATWNCLSCVDNLNLMICVMGREWHTHWEGSANVSGW